ncbi:MAG TPA: hypothetical protein VMS64_16400 [Candidatus Methylomirabilis sp.]|nr:hypothetical protein [Candidatus Methylomirabilis sp.]
MGKGTVGSGSERYTTGWTEAKRRTTGPSMPDSRRDGVDGVEGVTLTGRSRALREMLRRVQRVRPMEASVLILGVREISGSTTEPRNGAKGADRAMSALGPRGSALRCPW